MFGFKSGRLGHTYCLCLPGLQQPAFLSMISFHFLSIVIAIVIYKKNFPGNYVKLLFRPREGGGAMVKTFLERGNDVPTLWV